MATMSFFCVSMEPPNGKRQEQERKPVFCAVESVFIRGSLPYGYGHAGRLVQFLFVPESVPVLFSVSIQIMSGSLPEAPAPEKLLNRTQPDRAWPISSRTF